MSVTRKKTVISDGITLTELIDETKKTSGIAVYFLSPLEEESSAAKALLPIILTYSCEKYPSLTLHSRRLTELYGASMRGSVQSLADSHEICVSSSFIADRYALDGENISLSAAELLCESIFRPQADSVSKRFTSGDFHLMRSELLDDIDADINDKRKYARKKALKLVFQGEPAAVSARGEREAAAALTEEQAYAEYENLLSSANIEIYCTGCELSSQAKEKLVAEFSALKRKDVYRPIQTPSPIKPQAAFGSDSLDVVQSKMVIAYKTSENDLAAMRVFNGVFGGTPFSMLFSNVREKLSLCYYCSSSYMSLKHVILIDSGVEFSNIERARAEIQNQLDATAAGVFSDELLEQTKLSIVNTCKTIGDTPAGLVDWYHSQCMKPENEIVTPEEMISLTNNVTRDDVIRCAGSLKPDTVYILTGISEDKEAAAK